MPEEDDTTTATTTAVPDLDDSPTLDTSVGFTEYATNVDRWLTAIGERGTGMTDEEMDRYDIAQRRLQIGAVRTQHELGQADPARQAEIVAAARELAGRAAMDARGGGGTPIDADRMFRDDDYRKEHRGRTLEGVDPQMLTGPGDDRWAINLQAARNFAVARAEGITPREIVDARNEGIALVARNGRIVERATFVTGTIGEGAEWVPDEFATMLYTTFFDFSGIRQCSPYMDNTPTGREKTYYVINTIVGVGTSVENMITAEGATYDEKTDTTGSVTSKCVKATALIPLTNEMISDAGFELGAYAGDSMGRTIAQKVEYAGLFGDGDLTAGSVEPDGIMHTSNIVAAQTYTAGLATKLTGADMLGWTYNFLEGVDESMLKGLLKRIVWGNFRSQQGTDGHFVIPLMPGMPSRELETVEYKFSPYLPTLAASTTLGVLGEWMRGMIYRECDTLMMVRDPYSDIKSGKINWLADLRFDFRIRDNRAFQWLATP